MSATKSLKKDEVLLCECGEEFKGESGILKAFNHGMANCHFIEIVSEDDGTVSGFLAMGLEDNKYGGNVPDSAQVQREKKKNEPKFKDPEY